MILLKSCRRCRGDMFVENQTGIMDLVCLQCGYRRTVGQTPPTRMVTPELARPA